MPVVPATREAEVEGSLEPGEAEVAVSQDRPTALLSGQQSESSSQKQKTKQKNYGELTAYLFQNIFAKKLTVKLNLISVFW